jgi:predicted transcriptional regulator
LISREDFYARQSEEYLQESFGGSLPAFLVAFGRSKKLSVEEVKELQRLIDGMRGE